MTCSVLGSTMASVWLRLESANKDPLGVDCSPTNPNRDEKECGQCDTSN